MKNTKIKSQFGKRLADARKTRGLTQQELADQVQVSRRVIAYYEKESDFPPAHLLPDLAQVLKTSTDQLLGLKELKANGKNIPEVKILKKLRQTLNLPKSEQKAVLHYLDALLQKNRKKL